MAASNGAREPRPRRLSRQALRRLRQPLDLALVAERRNDDGELVRYIEGWRVIEQANAIFGPDRWGAELVGEVAYRPLPGATRRGATPALGIYTATVRVTVDGCLPHSDVGAAGVTEQTPEEHATACKAAVTDGLKRALRHFGAPFGLALAQRDELVADDLAGDPDELRRQVLAIASNAGSDETRTREWVAQRYGLPLEELGLRPLADAVRTLARGIERRNGRPEAA